MKFNELKKQIEAGQDIKELIEFKYVSLPTQQSLIKNVKSACLQEDTNGFLKIDYSIRGLSQLLIIVVNFTDIDFKGLYDKEGNINTKLSLEIFDYFKKNKFDKYIYADDSCQDFICILESELKQEIEINNSIGMVVKKTLNSLIEKVPDGTSISKLTSELKNEFSKLPPETLELLKGIR